MRSTRCFTKAGLRSFTVVAVVRLTIVPWFFGEQDSVVVGYVAWMSPTMFADFFEIPAVAMMSVPRPQHLWLCFDIGGPVPRFTAGHAGRVDGWCR